MIHLVTAIDARYVVPLQVAVASLRAHLPADTEVVLHVVHRSLGPTEQRALGRLVETRSCVPTDALAARIPDHPRYPAEVAFPLLLGHVLDDEVSRVLFIDADVLVLSDVTPVWEADLEGRTIGAVADGAIARCSSRRGMRDWRELGIPATHGYFNGGVLLVDLDAWRSRQITDRALARLGAEPEPSPFYHQEALNAVLWDSWLELDPIWNRLAAVAGRRRDAPSRRSDRRGIVHFAGRMKPWLGPIGGPFADDYRAQLAALGLPWPVADARRRLLGLYDGTVRDVLYPVERAAWNRGWI